MMVVGLTGGLASGKSTAAKLFAELGATIIDADEISRELTAPGGMALPKLRDALGDSAFASDGTFNRDAVRKTVFADAKKKARLESILHPMIAKEMRQRMHQRDVAGAYIMLVIPLLLETGAFANDCRRIVVVDCGVDLQIARAVNRGMNEDEARKIIAAQMPREERIARANGMINNGSDMGELQKEVRARHREFILLAEKEQKNV